MEPGHSVLQLLASVNQDKPLNLSPILCVPPNDTGSKFPCSNETIARLMTMKISTDLMEGNAY